MIWQAMCQVCGITCQTVTAGLAPLYKCDHAFALGGVEHRARRGELVWYPVTPDPGEFVFQFPPASLAVWPVSHPTRYCELPGCDEDALAGGMPVCQDHAGYAPFYMLTELFSSIEDPRRRVEFRRNMVRLMTHVKDCLAVVGD